MDNQKIFIVSALASLFLVSSCGSSDSDEDTNLLNDQSSSQAVRDPAPEFQEPGEYRCDGCPDSQVAEFGLTTVETSQNFVDVVTGAIGNGEFYVRGTDGSAIGGIIPTSADGQYSFTIPLFCGAQIVKCVWSNEAGSYVLITEVVRDACTNADIQVTLNWDDLGKDYELHLIKPGGTINDNLTDCTWTSCIGAGPDWGVAGDQSDDPLKDVDDTGSFGPENIYLSSPENGTYTVLVEHWGNGDAMSDGNLILNVAGQSTVASVTDFPSRHVWSVGTIQWPSGVVTLDGSTIDCNDNWSGGCKLELPTRTIE